MVDKFLKNQLKNYIKTHYVEDPPKHKSFNKCKATSYQSCKMSCETIQKQPNKSSIEDFIKIIKDKQTFSEYLFSLIDESGESDSDIYNRAGIDRRLFSKIRSNNDYHPSKNTIFALAIALRLDHTKTSRLLNKAGYEFSNNKLTDIIIMFCIENNIYDLYQVDNFLVEYKQKPIASEK